MREEVSNWWKQAKRDFQTAKNCRNSGDYYASVFFCQQAIEKGLKSLYILRKGTSPGTTHSLIFLAKEVIAGRFISETEVILRWLEEQMSRP